MARRPPQTMADIPASTRIAANEYISHLVSMEDRYRGTGDVEEYWEEMEAERVGLHDRFIKELRRLGITWRRRGDTEQIAQDIDDRRWRAKSLLVDRITARLALKLAGWKSTNLVLTFRRVVAFDSLRRHVRDLEWAGARVTGSRMLWGRRDVGEVRVTVRDVAEFVRRFKRTEASMFWRERWQA